MTIAISLHGRRHTNTVRWFAGAAGLAVVLVVLGASAATAGVPVGKVEIVAHNGSSIKGGDANTVFAVRPPADAKCPGDTAHDFYYLSSYLVPAGTTPTSIHFRGGIPTTSLGIISDGAFFGPANLALDTGAIVDIPANASWGRFGARTFFPHGEHSAVWDTGLACTDTNGVVVSYWNAELKFTASSSAPRGYTWRVVDAAKSPEDTHVNFVLLALAGGFLVLGIFVLRRRTRRAPETTGAR